MVERFEVGVIAGTHGIRGDVKVFPMTDDPARFKKLKSVYLLRKGRESVHEVSGVKLSGKFVVLHLSGFDTPEESRLLHNAELWIDRKDAIKLPKGKYFIPDLINMTVKLEDDSILGTLTDVIQTGANDVYVVTFEDGGEVLIPAIPDCILETHVEEEWMRVHLLPGLMD